MNQKFTKPANQNRNCKLNFQHRKNRLKHNLISKITSAVCITSGREEKDRERKLTSQKYESNQLKDQRVECSDNYCKRERGLTLSQMNCSSSIVEARNLKKIGSKKAWMIDWEKYGEYYEEERWGKKKRETECGNGRYQEKRKRWIEVLCGRKLRIDDIGL